MSDNLLTIKEVAKQLNVHWQTVRNYIDRKELKSVRIGKLVRVRPDDLQEFITDSKKVTAETEVELRYKVNGLLEFQQNLLKKKAQLTQQTRIIDHWFLPVNIKNMEEHNKWFDKDRGTGIRIREYVNEYGKKVSTVLETKRLTLAMNHDTFLETSVDIENYKKAKEFLEMIDRKEFLLIDKNRIIYKIDEFEIVIDSIKNYGNGVEIEYKGEIKNRNQVIKTIQDFAKQLGLNESMRFEKSLSVDAMHKLAEF